MSRSLFLRVAVVVMTAVGALTLAGCLGKNQFFANRPFPPSTVLQRVLVAIQNPSIAQTGALQIVDARYDIRNSENGTVPVFFINGYSGSLPSYIQNYPEQSAGYVYGSGDGSFTGLNYGAEKVSGHISGLPVRSSSVFITQDGRYVFAAGQISQFLTVVDEVAPAAVNLNLPNVYKVAVNPSGSVALAFVQNSNYAYRVIHLQQPNGTVMAPPTFPTESSWPKNVSPVDCQPVNLPLYCVVPVLDQNSNPIVFDRPYNTIFSSDGTTGWLLNCGPECGGQQSSVSFLSVGALDVYNFPGSTYPGPSLQPSPTAPIEVRRVPVPGGATMALYGPVPTYVAGQPSPTGSPTLYISGQQVQSDGLLEGFLSVMDLTSNQITATYPISDGTHTKMLFGDDNTLWIGSQVCQSGYRTANNLVNGCLTFFNMTNNAVLVEPWYGDLTGLCAIIQWHKMYTAYGGQLHIYATTNTGITTFQLGPYTAGSELYNGDVTVHGTAFDVAYMDAPSNAAD